MSSGWRTAARLFLSMSWSFAWDRSRVIARSECPNRSRSLRLRVVAVPFGAVGPSLKEAEANLASARRSRTDADLQLRCKFL